MARSPALSADARAVLSLLAPRGASSEADRSGMGLPEGWVVRAVQNPILGRTVPVALARLAAAGRWAELSEADQRRAHGVRAWAAARVALIRRVLGQLGPAVAAAGVRAFLCKGTALHGLLYDDPAARPSADVDVFVPVEDVLAFDGVLRGCGFEVEPTSGFSLEAFRRTGEGRHALIDLTYRAPEGRLAVEVKADPIGMGPPIRRIQALGEGGRPSDPYPGFRLPTAEVMVLQMAFSLARREQMDLLAFSELAGVLVARRDELDADRMLDLLRGEGLYGILRSVLSDTETLFPGVVPRRLFRREGRPAGLTPPRMRRGALRPRPPWSRAALLSVWAAPLLGSPRVAASAAWLWRRAVPPPPLLEALTGGRVGVRAVGTRLLQLAGANVERVPPGAR